MTAQEVLAEFCDDVEAAGGIVIRGGSPYLFSDDDDWPDLARTYLNACEVLKRKPDVVSADYSEEPSEDNS